MDSQITQVQNLIDEGQSFDFQNFCYPHGSGHQYGGDDTPEWLTWKTRAYNIVCQLMSEQSPPAKLAWVAIQTHTLGNQSDQFEKAKSTFLKALKLTLQALESDTFSELKKEASTSSSALLSNKVFVVHGHDHALKTEVENFLHQIGLDPIVLHRQPDQGKTIIEKFESNSDVGYAIILLTPDDLAYPIEQDNVPDEERQKEKRARPNVIFEFGYFVGTLSRSRVCCLYKGDVVLPSDISGIVYKQIEGSLESQAYAIIKELKAAGYQIRI